MMTAGYENMLLEVSKHDKAKEKKTMFVPGLYLRF
jgi:hypothetical protein